MSKYFPNLRNSVDDADVGQIITAFDRVEEDVKNAQGYVTSVAGKTGEVTLNKTDVGLDEVDNTADMNKPISTAVSNALQFKANAVDVTQLEISIAEVRADVADITKNYVSQDEMEAELAQKTDQAETDYYLVTLQTQIANKALKFAIQNITSSRVLLDDHCDLRGTRGAVGIMELSTPSTISDTYECYLSFRSGENPTSLTYSATPIKWVGVDCDSDGDFVPSPNRVYEIGIRNVGNDSDGNPMVIARVGVC